MARELAQSEVVEGRYRIEKVIELGPGAQVYRCADTARNDEPARLRVYEDPSVDDAAGPDVTAHEQALMEQPSRSPDLLQIRDGGYLESGEPWVVTEFQVMRSLRQVLEAQKSLPASAALEVAIGIADILAPLHSGGLVHLGVGIDSILIGAKSLRVWLDDHRFWRRSADTEPIRFLRSRGPGPDWSLGGEGLTTRTDCWDLGAILFRMITGEAPGFEAGQVTGGATVSWPSFATQQVDTELRDLIGACLAVNPAKRPKDAIELSSRLRQLLDAETQEARTTTLPRSQTGELNPQDFGNSGSFEIKDELGKGGMGMVYLALDTRLNRQVAIKVPNVVPGQEDDIRASLFREARVMANMPVHPNVVTVFAVDELVDRRPYVVMEYCEAGALRAKLRREKKMTLDWFTQIASDVCAGLAHAHKHNLIHKDIKPENVMISSSGVHKIGDFGIAHVVRRTAMMSSSMQAVSGTPAYMSPEQFENQELTPAADVYALGCLFYELCSGRPPFTGNEVWRQHFFDEPKPVKFLFESPHNAAIEQVLLRCLAKTPADRPADAEALWTELRRIIGGNKTGSLKQTEEALERESAKRGRATKISVGLAALLVVVLVGFIWFGPDPKNQPKLDVFAAGEIVTTGSRVVVTSLADLDVQLEPAAEIKSVTWTVGTDESPLEWTRDENRIVLAAPKRPAAIGRLTVEAVRAKDGGKATVIVDVEGRPWAADDAVRAALAQHADADAGGDAAKIETARRTLAQLVETKRSEIARTHLNPDESGLTELRQRVVSLEGAIARRAMPPSMVVKLDGEPISGPGPVRIRGFQDLNVDVEAVNGLASVEARFGDRTLPVPKLTQTNGKTTGHLANAEGLATRDGELVLKAVDDIGNVQEWRVLVEGVPFAPREEHLARVQEITQLIETQEFKRAHQQITSLEKDAREDRAGYLAQGDADADLRFVSELWDKLEVADRATTRPKITIAYEAQPLRENAAVEITSLGQLDVEVSAVNGIKHARATLGALEVGRATEAGSVALVDPQGAPAIGTLVVEVEDEIGNARTFSLTVKGKPFALSPTMQGEVAKLEEAFRQKRFATLAKDLDDLAERARAEQATHLNRSEDGLSPLNVLRRRLEAPPVVTCRVGGANVVPPVRLVGLVDLEIGVESEKGPLRVQADADGRGVTATVDAGDDRIRLQNPPASNMTGGTLTLRVTDAAGITQAVAIEFKADRFTLAPAQVEELNRIRRDEIDGKRFTQARQSLDRLRQEAERDRARYMCQGQGDFGAIESALADIARREATPVPPPGPTFDFGTRPQGDGAVYAGMRWRQVRAGGSSFLATECEVPWASFKLWYQRQQDFGGVDVGADGDPATKVPEAAVQAFANAMGARLPTILEWNALAGEKPRKMNASERSGGLGARTGTNNIEYKKLQPSVDQEYGGHGYGGLFFHVGGNVKELVEGPDGLYTMGNSYKDSGPWDERSRYEKPSADIGFRLVLK